MTGVRCILRWIVDLARVIGVDGDGEMNAVTPGAAEE
jgi:hypothetical protein